MIIPTRNPLDIGKDCPEKFCRRIDTDAFCRRVSAEKNFLKNRFFSCFQIRSKQAQFAGCSIGLQLRRDSPTSTGHGKCARDKTV